MLTRIDKAIVAGGGAAAAVITARGGNLDLTTVELAIGSFLVVGLLTLIVPNKTA